MSSSTSPALSQAAQLCSLMLLKRLVSFVKLNADADEAQIKQAAIEIVTDIMKRHVQPVLKDADDVTALSVILGNVTTGHSSLTDLAGALNNRDLVSVLQDLAVTGASPDPTLQELKVRIGQITTAQMDAALNALNTPSTTNPTDSRDGDGPADGPYMPIGIIDVDKRSATAADAAIRAATRGKITSTLDLINSLMAAEREVIRVRNLTPVVAVEGTTEELGCRERKVRAADIFGDAVSSQAERDQLNFEITVFDWERPHARIPAKRPSYVFDARKLRTSLYAIERGRNSILVGPTGCGKTVWCEQIAARLGRPFFRIPIDGEMRRRELIGGLKQVSGDNGPQMIWVDGLLTQAMSLPAIVDFDEFDRIDQDLAYLAHQALEGAPIQILEDGGRIIPRHPRLSFMATSNTTGVADSANRYQLQSEMSEATRDRFPFWLAMTYPSLQTEAALLRTAHKLDAHEATLLARLSESLRAAFETGRTQTACSVRQVIETAEYAAFSGSLMEAVAVILVQRAATEDDRAATIEMAVQIFGEQFNTILAEVGIIPKDVTNAF